MSFCGVEMYDIATDALGVGKCFCCFKKCAAVRIDKDCSIWMFVVDQPYLFDAIVNQHFSFLCW